MSWCNFLKVPQLSLLNKSSSKVCIINLPVSIYTSISNSDNIFRYFYCTTIRGLWFIRKGGHLVIILVNDLCLFKSITSFILIQIVHRTNKSCRGDNASITGSSPCSMRWCRTSQKRSWWSRRSRRRTNLQLKSKLTVLF